MKINKIFNFIIIIFVNLLISNPSFAQRSDSSVVLNSPMFYLKDEFKLINDSIRLNGFLVFEFRTNNNIFSFKESSNIGKNGFFTNLCFFVYNLSDIISPNSIKYYYNSNKLPLYAFIFYEPKNEVEKIDVSNFNSTFRKIDEKIGNNYKIFSIEKLKLDDMRDHKTYKIINDISNSKYYLIYKINLDAFLYVTTIFDNSEIFSNNQIDLTLGFFEPISDTNIFELIQDLDNIDSNFVKSDSLNELFEIK